MRVAIYVRVSDERDQTVPWQLSACRAKAAAEGWEVVGEYEEDRTSAFDRRKDRPEYERLKADLVAGRFDAPLATDTERLLRQWKEGQWWLDQYDAGRVRYLKFTDQADKDLTLSSDRKQWRDDVSAAIHYSERLSEKIR